MQKTQKGRVVYDRKPHMFSLKDVLRISLSLTERFDYLKENRTYSNFYLSTLTRYFIWLRYQLGFSDERPREMLAKDLFLEILEILGIPGSVQAVLDALISWGYNIDSTIHPGIDIK